MACASEGGCNTRQPRIAGSAKRCHASDKTGYTFHQQWVGLECSGTVATEAQELHIAERRPRGRAEAIEHAKSGRYNTTKNA